MPLTNAADLSIWLSEHRRIGAPVGVEANLEAEDFAVVFVGALPGDEVSYTGVIGDEGAQVLARVFDSKDLLKLVAYSTPEIVAFLSWITQLEPRSVLPHIVGDVESAEYTIGRYHEAQTSLVDEARDNLLTYRTLEQMELPLYYKQVAQPLARMMALPWEEATWTVEYSDMLLRVIAKYSAEPLLTQAFLNNLLPSQSKVTDRLREMYPEATHEFTTAAIVYAALGGDLAYMAVQYPGLTTELDGIDLKALGHNLDKAIPSVRLMASDLWQSVYSGYGPSKQFKTLYGRTLLLEGADSPGVYLDHVLNGTVQDLKNVFAVSAANLGSTSIATPIIRGDEPVITIKGNHKGDIYEFVNQLKPLAALGHPLQPVPLQPIISLVRGENA